ncbi:MAG: LysM domain-containing protein [Verrucomicrobiia bacterium]
MNDQLQALLQQTGTAAAAFPPTSRYHETPVATLTMPDGREVAYLKRRFVPPPERFALLQEHTVTEGERLDHIAAKYLGDPEQFWRLCDANGAVRPDELLEPVGRSLHVTLPENIPGAQHG